MKKEKYMKLRETLGLTRTEFGNLLNYGEGKQPYAYMVVYEKETGTRNISNSDTAICGLLTAGLKIAPKTMINIVKLTAKKERGIE